MGFQKKHQRDGARLLNENLMLSGGLYGGLLFLQPGGSVRGLLPRDQMAQYTSITHAHQGLRAAGWSAVPPSRASCPRSRRGR